MLLSIGQCVTLQSWISLGNTCQVYQMLLCNFHCAPNRNNPSKGAPGHDPLHKVRPLVEMCQRNFHLKYRPEKCLSFNEGCCGFSGRFKFLTYNKDKP